MGASRGLVSETIRDQVAELTDLASHSRSRRPIYHIHADPPPSTHFSEDAWTRYWDRLEAELGLQDQAFAEQVHVKQGREHRHREYSLVRPDGTTMPLSHDHARREKVGRLTEIEEGQQLTAGAHNRAVLAALDREGRQDGAAAIREAGLGRGPRPRSPLTPDQRAQAERTGTDPKALGAAVLTAWRVSDDAAAFRAALGEQGLRLAQGDRAAVVVDATGNVHPLARMLGRESKAAGGDRIAAADVSVRLAGLDLPRHIPGAAAEPVPVAAGAPQGTPHATSLASAPATTDRAAPRAPTPVCASPGPVAAVAGAGAPAETPSQDGGVVRPLDASWPGDWLRVLNEATEALNKQTAARVPTKKGRPEDDAIKIGREFGRSIRDAFDDTSQRAADARAERDEAAEALVDRGPEGNRGDGREGRPVDAPGDRQEGTGACPVRSHPGGNGGGLPPSPPHSAGAAGEGDLAARPGDPAPGANRGEPIEARAARGRDRVQARRESIGLAAAIQALGGRLAELTRLVASPPTVASVQTEWARTAMAASRERVAAVLATAPWPNPADRNRGRLQDLARDQVKATMDARATAAAAAVERAAQLRGRVGFVGRALAAIGLQTPSVQAAAEAAREAGRAERAAKDVRLDYRDDLVHADRTGAAEADRRQRQQDQWEDRSDVLAAGREDHGNRLVAGALRAGDPEIKGALRQEDGLQLAREVLLRREAERLAETRRQQLQHDQRMAALAPLTRADPAPAGFRR